LFKGIGGAEYIYSLLTGYTGEEVEMAGAVLYENTAYGGDISMAPPLSEGMVEYAAHGGDEEHTIPVPEATVEQMSRDVAAFLMWTAEPQLAERKQAGFRNVLFLAALTVLLYFTNKVLWAPVKRKDQPGEHG
ncbi:MAG TPA: cytochrome c1, partial [Thermohalobaculum sp.]|nr:cytochrome c1 [Thermohalobaculum sp.]